MCVRLNVWQYYSHGPMTIAHLDLKQYTRAVAFHCERGVVMEIHLTLRLKV